MDGDDDTKPGMTHIRTDDVAGSGKDWLWPHFGVAIPRGSRAFPLFADRYHLLGFLGEGGMGCVLHVQDMKPETGAPDRFALKIALHHKDFEDIARGGKGNRKGRLDNEWKGLKKLQDHFCDSRTPRFHGTVDYRYLPPGSEVSVSATAFLMERLVGRTLLAEDRIRHDAGRPWTVAEVIEVGFQMTDELRRFADLELINRDIKLDNIWLRGDGTGAGPIDLVMIDFGLIRELEVGGDLEQGMTGEGGLGNYRTSPRDQISGKDTGSSRLDFAPTAQVLHYLAYGGYICADDREDFRDPDKHGPEWHWLSGIMKRMHNKITNSRLDIHKVHAEFRRRMPYDPGSHANLSFHLPDGGFGERAQAGHRALLPAAVVGCDHVCAAGGQAIGSIAAVAFHDSLTSLIGRLEQEWQDRPGDNPTIDIPARKPGSGGISRLGLRSPSVAVDSGTPKANLGRRIEKLRAAWRLYKTELEHWRTHIRGVGILNEMHLEVRDAVDRFEDGIGSDIGRSDEGISNQCLHDLLEELKKLAVLAGDARDHLQGDWEATCTRNVDRLLA